MSGQPPRDAGTCVGLLQLLSLGISNSLRDQWLFSSLLSLFPVLREVSDCLFLDATRTPGFPLFPDCVGRARNQGEPSAKEKVDSLPILSLTLGLLTTDVDSESQS